MYLFSILACALALMTWWVHTFLGHRVVLKPMLAAEFSSFARATIEVCWHATTLMLFAVCGVLVAATISADQSTGQLLWLIAFSATVPFAGLFIFISHRRFGRWWKMPQSFLLGSVGLASSLAWFFPIQVSLKTGYAIILASLLLLLALLHVLWALGNPWPGKSSQELSLMVVGNKPGASFPGSTLTFAVAAFLGGAGAAVLVNMANADISLLSGFIWFLAGMFLLRGVAGYIDPLLRPWTKNMPFKHWNQVLYSPVSLLMGMLALGLALGGT